MTLTIMPPALDYVERNSCEDDDYDYFYNYERKALSNTEITGNTFFLANPQTERYSITQHVVVHPPSSLCHFHVHAGGSHREIVCGNCPASSIKAALRLSPRLDEPAVTL